jgi:hypothetical protein
MSCGITDPRLLIGPKISRATSRGWSATLAIINDIITDLNGNTLILGELSIVHLKTSAMWQE